jgi:DNA topoisomerase IA
MRKVAKNLEIEAKKCRRLVIWTDCDREGEHIGYEIVSVCKKANPYIQVNFNIPSSISFVGGTWPIFCSSRTVF